MWVLRSPHRKIERTIHQTCPSTVYITNDIEFSSPRQREFQNMDFQFPRKSGQFPTILNKARQ
jgi:hypothetical protein